MGCAAFKSLEHNSAVQWQKQDMNQNYEEETPMRLDCADRNSTSDLGGQLGCNEGLLCEHVGSGTAVLCPTVEPSHPVTKEDMAVTTRNHAPYGLPLKPPHKSKADLMPNPSEFAYIYSIVRQTPASAAKSPPLLAAYLTSICLTDLQKVRAIYCWLAANITYDFEGLEANTDLPEDVTSVLRSKLARCHGFSVLCQALCQEVSIPCLVITGIAKSFSHTPLSVYDADSKNNHAWNLVHVQGEWHPLDCAWGAGSVTKEEGFTRKFNEFYFLTKPEHFLTTHFPNMDGDAKLNARYQLVAHPIDLHTFSSMVEMTDTALTLGLCCLTHTVKVIEVKNDVTVKVRASQDPVVAVHATLTCAAGRRQSEEELNQTAGLLNLCALGVKSSSSVCSVSSSPEKTENTDDLLTSLGHDGTCCVFVRPRFTGTYLLTIGGRTASQEGTTLHSFITYVIKCHQVASDLHPFPAKYRSWGLQYPIATECGIKKTNALVHAVTDAVSSTGICMPKGAEDLPFLYRANKGVVKVTIAIDHKTLMHAELFHAENMDEDLGRFLLLTCTDKAIVITAHLPYPGYYKLSLFASHPAQSSLPFVGDLLLYDDEGLAQCDPFPPKSGYWGLNFPAATECGILTTLFPDPPVLSREPVVRFTGGLKDVLLESTARDCHAKTVKDEPFEFIATDGHVEITLPLERYTNIQAHLYHSQNTKKNLKNWTFIVCHDHQASIRACLPHPGYYKLTIYAEHPKDKKCILVGDLLLYSDKARTNCRPYPAHLGSWGITSPLAAECGFRTMADKETVLGPTWGAAGPCTTVREPTAADVGSMNFCPLLKYSQAVFQSENGEVEVTLPLTRYTDVHAHLYHERNVKRKVKRYTFVTCTERTCTITARLPRAGYYTLSVFAAHPGSENMPWVGDVLVAARKGHADCQPFPAKTGCWGILWPIAIECGLQQVTPLAHAATDNVNSTDGCKHKGVKDAPVRYTVVDGELEIQLPLAHPTDMQVNLFHSDDPEERKSLKNFAYVVCTKSRATITLHLPRAGYYRLNLYALHPKRQTFPFVGDLMVHTLRGRVNFRPFPVKIGSWGLSPKATECGLRKEEDAPAVFTAEDGQVRIQLPLDRPTKVQAQLFHADDAETNLNQYTLCMCTDEMASITVHLPYAGNYKLSLFASTSEQKVMPFVGDLLITADKGFPNCQPFPLTTGSWGMQHPMATDCGLKKIDDAPFMFSAVDGEIKLQISLTRHTMMAAYLFHADNMEENLQKFTFLTCCDNQVTVTARLPRPGYYMLSLFASHPEHTTLPFVGNLLLHAETGHANQHCFPVKTGYWGLEYPIATECGLREVTDFPVLFSATNGEAQIVLPVDRETNVQVAMYHAERLEKDLKQFTDPKLLDSSQLVISLRLPRAGHYRLSIFASHSAQNYMPLVGDLLIYSHRGHEHCQPFPATMT